MSVQSEHQSFLVAEIIANLVEKFDRLPVKDRDLMAFAMLEASAWVIVTRGLNGIEMSAEADVPDVDLADQTRRNGEYVKVFDGILACLTEELAARKS